MAESERKKSLKARKFSVSRVWRAENLAILAGETSAGEHRA